MRALGMLLSRYRLERSETNCKQWDIWKSGDLDDRCVPAIGKERAVKIRTRLRKVRTIPVLGRIYFDILEFFVALTFARSRQTPRL